MLVRDSTADPGPAFYFGVLIERLTAGLSVRTRWRTDRDRSTRHREVPPGPWLRIERRGDRFTSATSADGESWQTLQEESLPELSGALHAGVCAYQRDVEPAPSTFTPMCVRASSLALFPRDDGAVLRGDANADGTVDLADAVFLLSWLFQGGADPSCEAAGDVNSDGAVNISDPTALLNWLFEGGAAPPAPAPGCAL